jgi:lysozyme
VSARALELAAACIKTFEGCARRLANGLIAAYRCPAGIWTQGWGSTSYANGRPITADSPPVSQQTADRLFELVMPRYAGTAAKLSPLLSQDRNDARLAGITSFIYNLGPTRYAASTLRRKVNAGDWKGAAAEIVKWNRAGGRVLPGLTLRRAAEARLLTMESQ